MTVLTISAAGLIAGVFGWGALAKVLRFSEWRQALRAYGLPPNGERYASLVVPAGEGAVVVLLAAGRARAGAALTLALLATFSSGLLFARQKQGDLVPCGCFGRATPHDFRLLMARNGGLALAAGAILIDGHDRLVTAGGFDPAMLLPAALVLVALVIALWMGRELIEALRRP